jgi:quinol monooxygenase YgiN
VTESMSLMVVFTCRPGHESTVREMLTAMLTPTRAEPGCLEYILHESLDDPAVFAFYETWRANKDWDVHMLQPHLRHLTENLPQHLTRPIGVRHLHRLDI